MDTRRLFLLLALGLIVLMLWTDWRTEHPTAPPPASRAASVSAATNSAGGRAAAGPAPAGGAAPAAGSAAMPAVSLAAPTGPAITVRTDVLELKVALHGAAITDARLLKYPQKRGGKAPVALLSPSGPDSVLVYPQLAGRGLPGVPDYSAAAGSFALAPGQRVLRVPLSWSGNGLQVTKTLVLTRGSYRIRIETRIANGNAQSTTLTPGLRLVGSDPVTANHLWDHFLPKYWAYRGPAYYDGSYEKLPAEALSGQPLDKRFSAGWIASVRQYFVAAAIPPSGVKAEYFGRAIDDDGYDVGYRLPPVAVPAGGSAASAMSLYLGPKLQGKLGAVAPGLKLTVDYGKAKIISGPLFSILSWIHGLLGNWGWSIVVLVLLIKAVFYWPQRMSARSMAKMRKLQPRIKHLQERFKDDKQKLSQATMELYRKEGANPVSGCLPMLIQVPIFIGLFYVLINSVELRQAPWVLWIHDLSAPDPLYILPILYGIVSLVQFRLQPQAVDNAQAKLMMVMPLLFTFFYAIFPSGLVLYYLLNTMLNVAIQWRVNRELGMPMALWPKKKKAP